MRMPENVSVGTAQKGMANCDVPKSPQPFNSLRFLGNQGARIYVFTEDPGDGNFFVLFAV